MKASKHEQELIDYINNKMFPIYAEWSKGAGVCIYAKAEDSVLDEGWNHVLINVADDDTSMAAALYNNFFNEDRIQDIPEKMWKRLYAKIEEFTKENAKEKVKE